MALQLFDDFEETSLVYAIQSNGMNETKFIFNLNKILGFQFRRVDDLDITIKSKVFCFSLYEFEDEIAETQYYLIKNLSHPKISDSENNSLFGQVVETEFILNKYKGFDYIIKIPYSEEPVFMNDVSLRDADFIQNFSILNNLSEKEKNLLTL